ncbi:hypothetical protein [Streptomyces lunaelactis]|uniref:hypothetical protein n=1 Tax=Streptomyces lunaelactis TaxID=1535768 RepID=UPI001584FA67|nr:hypothetical protein [Streptomyces lunaelactis]NUK04378.1 hypothetical protein [Streptomyces lunaelactis]NUK21034.1 hypothetical protein [Streptomyces lunaelactis]
MADMEYTGTNQPNLTPGDAAEFALMLHDAPDAHFGRHPVPVLAYEPGASLSSRREAFRVVYDAIVGRIGEPTLYGGSAEGPNVRWRDGRRLVMLAGDRHRAQLSVHGTDAFESEERRTFEWGGDAWSADEPHDVGFLPYAWQLDRSGPGERPTERPGCRQASSLEHFENGLELLLAAWVEQLPVQVGEDWASFSLTSAADRGRQLLISFALADGLHVSVDDRDGEDTPERELLMRSRGWHSRDRGWWQADFSRPERDDVAEVARLTVTELRARGTKEPEELRARDASCKDRGELWLPGLGIRH